MAGDIWVVVLLAVTLMAFVVGNILNTHIRHHHPEAWDRLGRPTLWNNSPANSLKAGKFFVLSNEYRLLNDAVLDRYVLFARLLVVLTVSILAVGAILMFTGKFG